MCVVQWFLGIPCPGCGLLHALWSVLHFDWRASFSTFPAWPVVVLFFFFRRSIFVGKVFVAVLFSQWILRLITPPLW